MKYMEGKFIVIEGIDGAGISTQSQLLKKYLLKRYNKVIVTKEPTNSSIGRLIKLALSKKIKVSDKTIQLLFLADRSAHLESEILPALDNKYIVISDRYIFSSLAYGYVSGLNYRWLRYMNNQFRLPDLGILIDISVQSAMKRISGEAGLEIFSRREKLDRVRKTFISLAKEYKMKIVNGEGSIEEVHSKIVQIVDKFLSS